MENDSSIRPNNNRKRGPVPESLPATSSSSLATSTCVERQDAVVEMPTTPEQLESMISIRVTAALASKEIMNNSSVPTPLALNATFGSTISTNSTVTSPTPTLGLATSPIALPSIGTPPTVPSTPTSPTISSVPISHSSPPTVVVVRDIAKLEYLSTTSMSCDLLKLHMLVENGGDNKKRKEMILTILGGEDLLSMLNGTRSKPIATSINPTGYTGRRIIVEANGEDAILGAVDVVYYLHDSRRLYIAITIAVSESLQYMFPAATSTRNGVLLWDLAIQHLFGTTYDDILEASDRLRRWHIDPSKNLKYDLHKLSQLIERVNETSQHDIAESQILAIINKEILKDPREGLRIIAHNSSINKTSLNGMLNMLNESSYVLPFNSKVKINELKVSTNKGYCNKFQIGNAHSVINVDIGMR